MKKISFVLILFLVSQLVNAQGANAVIFSENGEKFTVYINEAIHNLKPESSVKILNMSAPQYKMNIVFEDVRLGETSFHLFLEAGMERTFSLSKNTKGKYVMRFIGSVPVTVGQVPIAAKQFQDTIKQNKVFNIDTLDSEINPHINIAQSNINIVERPVYLPGYEGPIGCERPISNQLFLDLKNNIAEKSFEETKLTAAKQLLVNQCLLTSQIKDLAKLFTFEETKLNFAKYAYSYTYDIVNYYIINDVFTFESSIEELNSYIKTKQ